MILAIDTSLGSGAALVDFEGTVLGEAWSDDPLAHAEVIGDLLSQVLATGEAPTHVAAGMGPGPFTGLRIGIVAARTFAQARGHGSAHDAKTDETKFHAEEILEMRRRVTGARP